MKKRKNKKSAPARLSPPLKADWSLLIVGVTVFCVCFLAMAINLLSHPLAHRFFSVDVTGMHILFLDTFVSDEFPSSGLRTAQASPFFPDLLLWSLLSFLPADWLFGVYAFLLVAIGAAGWVFCARRLGGGALAQNAVLFVHAAQFLVLSYPPGGELFVISLMTSFHNGPWAMLPWLVYLTLDFFKPAISYGKAAVLFVLLAATILSDLLITPWFVAPALLAGVFCWWKKKNNIAKVFLLAGVIAAAAVGGRAMLALLSTYTESPNVVKFSLFNLFDFSGPMGWQLNNLTILAKQSPLLAFVWFCFLFLCLFVFWGVVLRRNGRSSFSAEQLFFAVFLPAAIGASLLSPVVAGHLRELQYPDDKFRTAWEVVRLSYPAFYLPMFVGWVFMPQFFAKRIIISPRIASITCGVLFLFAASPLLANFNKRVISPLKTPYADCIRAAANRLGWTGGIGVYRFFDWAVIDENNPIKQQATIENFGGAAKDKQKILGVMWDATNRHRHSGVFQVVAVDDYKGKRYVRIPRTKDDFCKTEYCTNFTPTRSLDEETVRAVFGEPDEIVECEGVGLFHYDPPFRLDFSDKNNPRDYPIGIADFRPYRARFQQK